MEEGQILFSQALHQGVVEACHPILGEAAILKIQVEQEVNLIHLEEVSFLEEEVRCQKFQVV